MNIPISIQLYTLRNQLENDFKGVLEEVARLGFDGVELAGYSGLTVEEVKSILDELNLQVSSSHIPLERFKNELEQVIAEHKLLGCTHLIVPFLMPEERSEEGYQQLILLLKEVKQVCEREGMTLCYHNHDFEFEKIADGRYALQAILEETGVEAEFDIYWITKAGERPVDWLQRYQDRVSLVHLKDMTVDEEQFFAELGTGGVDIKSVLQVGEEIGVKWWVVEQDESKIDPLESIKISMDYLKKIGVK
ncbi:sugar phosphate isomerase/epimerase family protein [Alkalihalobacillus pseudalcaliphilus]|uniref:sugar phosphate isomerase/epimerase family protein n=1 Tax=Alkalihalobacillus pseudalcaliphilus TaxID=79884 RepID=UPI00064D7CBF|nr:sugar phosphate isomerase/epimerase [Alkalihalobacillus pseudalcaliphilus]KMK78121.1 xylose isomerase [Alkalihalobacillus pseudalcaliphilus]